MSFGLSVTTTNGELLLDERFTVPALLSHVTTPTFSNSAAVVGNTSLTWDSYTYARPSGLLDANRLEFFTIPTLAANCSFVFNVEIGDPTKGTATVGRLTVLRPSATTRAASIPNGLPEVYIFGTSALAATGAAYGLRVWKPDGTVAFDIGYLHLQIDGSVNLAFTAVGSPGTQTSTSVSAAPAKAAFLISPNGGAVWTRRGALLESDAKYYQGTVFRSGTNLTTFQGWIGIDFEDLPNVASTDLGKTPQFCPWINAALYD
jgi:hypothetical protein